MKPRALLCALVFGLLAPGGVAWAESPNCVDDEGSFIGQATEIQDIAELDDGTLYAVDGEKAHVFRRSSDGLFYTVSGGTRGDADGSMAEARFMGPYGLASGGDRLYIVDTRGHRLRVLVGDQVYTVAGDGKRGFKDGPGAAARFAHPVDAVVLPSGAILVADKLNHAIRRVIVGTDPTSSVVQTVVGNGLPGSLDGPLDVAQLRWPVGVAVGPDDSVYVADQGNHAIRRIWPDGVVTTWAGGTYGYYSGSRHAARLGYVGRIAADSQGWLFITDRVIPGVLSIDPDGLVTPLTGTGIGSGTGNAAGSHYRFPEGITVTAAGEVLVADIGNGGVKVLAACGEEISSLQGSACVGPVCDMTLDDTYGCTDSSATNHDPDAELDNGSCIYACTPSCQNGGSCNAVGHCVCAGTGHHGPTCGEADIASCPTGAGPAFEVCDGVDNDCNGQVDDGIGQVSCGIGGCAQTVDACANGIELDCDPLALQSDEICDGVDNDCDGQTDEGQGAAYCGFGVCQRLVSGCVDGVPTDCDPLDGASNETCNTLDDDCDGKVDEAFGEVLCGTGVCRHVQANCIAGVAQTCDPMKGAYAEVCDGLDNDCDGETDEGTGQVSCGVGACEKTIDTCVGGVPQSCNATAGSTPETCDDIDNDCNGLTDDALLPISCGLGACAHSIDGCLGGVTQTCDPMAGAKPEVCGDGVDDDCDGLADDGCPADDDNDGYGVDVDCDDANPDIHPGADEVCDDQTDNDCDGQTDEGCTVDLDQDGHGEEVDCNDLDPDIHPGAVETCADATDNNCDGQVDEGCDADGDGHANDVDCDDSADNVYPGAVEVCDGVDNNCDTVIDENMGQTTCGVGACAHTIEHCINGVVQPCDPNESAPPELCGDGLDNNCDGKIDEGAACFVATGGIKHEYGDYVSHTFTSSGTFTVTGGEHIVEVLAVAGGGGGGGGSDWGSAGGGAGGMLVLSGQTVAAWGSGGSGEYTITVGAGGAGGGDYCSPDATNGEDSVWDQGGDLEDVSFGGGGGGCSSKGGDGGSGGGSMGGYNASTVPFDFDFITYPGGSGVQDQGHEGGTGFYSPLSDIGAFAAGGGGAGEAGQPTSSCGGGLFCPGTGGDGLANDFRTGSDIFYAGGGSAGGGMGQIGPPSAGGAGGGADGLGNSYSKADSGVANTGGGGGGVGNDHGSGGDGGSGIVVIRYLKPITCTPSAEVCDGVDNDCDTEVDEGVCHYLPHTQDIFAGKCNDCHTAQGAGGHNIGTYYADGMLDAYSCDGLSKAECAIARIKDGSMPAYAGCGGAVPDGAPNSTVCVTESELAMLEAWAANDLAACSTPPCWSVPGAPSSLTLSAGTPAVTAINLTWSAPSDDGGAQITGYRIKGNGSVIMANTGSTDTAFSVPGLSANTSYAFSVAAINEAGTGPDSTTETLSTAAPFTYTTTGSPEVNTYGNYTSLTFKSSGSLKVQAGSTDIDFYILGGGGSGATTESGDGAGGGGAGAAYVGTASDVNSGTHAVTVGAGGSSAGQWMFSPAQGISGSPSSLAISGGDTYTAKGGGGGGAGNSAGSAGGCGGGGGSDNANGAGGNHSGAGTGHKGGSGYYSTMTGFSAGGGGGGVGSSGQNAHSGAYPGAYSGNGGNGASNDYRTGSPELRGGGGGGTLIFGNAANTIVRGTGGTGGGTDGAQSGASDNAPANSGSGSGGSGAYVGSGKGGSGIVILRFKTP